MSTQIAVLIMAAAPGIPIALSMNCGFSRVAIKELSHHKQSRQNINLLAREDKFKELFSSSFELEESAALFERSPKHGSLFNKICTEVLNMFNSLTFN